MFRLNLLIFLLAANVVIEVLAAREISSSIEISVSTSTIGTIKNTNSTTDLSTTTKTSTTTSSSTTTSTSSYGTSSASTHSKTLAHEATPRDADKTKELIAIVSMAVAIVLVMIVLVGFCFFLRRRRRNAERVSRKLLNKELEKRMDEADAMDYDTLSKNADDIVGSAGKAKYFFKKVMDDISKIKLAKDKTVCVDDSRFPLLPCAKSSMVTVTGGKKGQLHMNKISDFYTFPLYLSTAPASLEFPKYWKAIVGENIGLVVWLGEYIDGCLERIAPYIPVNENATKTFGDYTVTNVNTKTRPFEFIRRVKVSRRGKKSAVHIIFVHALYWPEKRVPEAFSKLNELLSYVQLYQEYQSSDNLPGVLIHCTSGTQASAAFCASYIGRQIWLSKKKINLRALIVYIQKYRYGAFDLPDQNIKNIQIIFGIIKDFAKASAEIKINSQLIVLPEEKENFESGIALTVLDETSVRTKKASSRSRERKEKSGKDKKSEKEKKLPKEKTSEKEKKSPKEKKSGKQKSESGKSDQGYSGSEKKKRSGKGGSTKDMPSASSTQKSASDVSIKSKKQNKPKKPVKQQPPPKAFSSRATLNQKYTSSKSLPPLSLPAESVGQSFLN